MPKGRSASPTAARPTPTEQNHHPFGLFSYALSYTGYERIEFPKRYETIPGVLRWRRPELYRTLVELEAAERFSA